MKIFVIDTLYPKVIEDVYSRNPGLKKAGYDKQKKEIFGLEFGTSNFYSQNLARLAITAEEFIFNAEILQKGWEHENVPWFLRWKLKNWQLSILEKQIKKFSPDVIYCQSLNDPGPDFLRKIKKDNNLLVVAQLGSKAELTRKFMSVYDLVLTSFPHFVEKVKRLGVDCEYFRLGFEPGVLNTLRKTKKQHGAVFIGGFSSHHLNTYESLEYLADRVTLDVWGYGVDSLAEDNPIRKNFHPESLWGRDMYNLFYNSKVVVNRHGAIAENNANNMRLYEATGVGTMLITDYKDNLNELFKVGKEIETYKTKEELADKVKYYLKNESKREKIARAGQERTLRDHTYEKRMQELAGFLKKYAMVVGSGPVSYGNEVITKPDVAKLAREFSGVWKNAEIPLKQLELNLEELKKIDTITPMRIAVKTLRTIAKKDASLLDVGCSSGYYSEVFEKGGVRLKYAGCDYSPSFIAMAKKRYPNLSFKVSNAANLKYPNNKYDIVFSSGCIQNIVNYSKAIKEAARVTKKYVLFQRTPVVHLSNTTYTHKIGYGLEMLEIIFNEEKLLREFKKNNLFVSAVTTDGKFTIKGLEEPVYMKNYVCEKM